MGIDLEPARLQLALTHRSYAYEKGGLPTNERLEFLGDAVLQVIVTEHLFGTYPDLSEGQLAKLRAAVVNSRALADVARRIGVGPHLRLGRGEETTGGRDKSSILADTLEALIGAVFTQHGIEVSRVFVHALFDPVMAQAATLGAALDWKTSLQELASLRGLGVPTYSVTEDGPDHAKTFRARVLMVAEPFGPGSGTNKKQAEQQAAEIAFAELTERFRVEDAAAREAAEADGTGQDGTQVDGAGVDGVDLGGVDLDGAAVAGAADGTTRAPRA